jgi:hypothetical protein
VKVKWRHGETSQFGFSDNDNMSETERENAVAKFPRPVAYVDRETVWFFGH